MNAKLTHKLRSEDIMKYVTMAAIGLAVATAANSVGAYSFSPTETKFHLNGKVQITTDGRGQGRCLAKWGNCSPRQAGIVAAVVQTMLRMACRAESPRSLPVAMTETAAA